MEPGLSEKPGVGEKNAGGHDIRMVVGAAAAGTVFEWYDFYIYGSILAVIASQFFGGVNETAAYVFTLLGFAAGFVARPFGALVFGRIGDRVGRKQAFIITISIMGGATFVIGLLPTYSQVGILAPILLISMRVLQGFAVGGEYGGAVIYVAEHAPADKRGYYTSWLQTTAAAGLVAALLVVLGTRRLVGEEAFAEWGWRIPFLLSILLLTISLWVRMRLQESPVFEKIRAEGTISKAPITESFLRWASLKFVLIALSSFMAAHAVIWYSIHFYSQVFLQRVLKVDGAIVSELMLITVTTGLPMYLFFGWLSDKVGRKPIMLSAIGLSALLFFPLFQGLANAANPALVEALRSAPISVIADPETCSLQFDPVGVEEFVSSCDIAKSALAGAGVSYQNEAAAPGTIASIQIGPNVLESFDGSALSADALVTAKSEFDTRLRAALSGAGYPERADPDEMNKPMMIGIMLIFMVLAAMIYGPLAAVLVELFPTRIRYTALSLPYHVGNGWFGGFLPAIAVAIVAATGNIYSGFWYPVLIAGATVVFGVFLLPETYKRDIEKL
jgi:MFS family permease